MNVVKSSIKKLLVGNQNRRYESAVKSKNMDYDMWIRGLEERHKEEYLLCDQKVNNLTIDIWEKKNEKHSEDNDGELAKSQCLCKLIEIYKQKNDLNCEAQYLVAEAEDLPQICKFLKKSDYKINGVILKTFAGNISEFAVYDIHKAFSENKNLILIYGDEDVLEKTDKRRKPWFKPDWAPDDFLSYFYFGGMVAVRSGILTEYALNDTDDIYEYLYRVLLFNGAFDKHPCGVVKHIPYILFHSEGISSYNKVCSMRLRCEIKERVKDTLISVVIPSKDHPDILFRCIDSFVEITRSDHITYEFILVDNGSNEKNKATIESLILSYENAKNVDSITYLYEERIFNFSYMCNKGAQMAKGEYILFLNDDIEIIEKDWLDKMLEKACLPYAGAVGAKLIYPESIQPKTNIIQHAGITNLRIGPAHKLQFLSDSKDHYFGRNRYCHDMMGVTGACLMVRKTIFEKTGGFDEKLAVAFNDVDLCYTIYEMGYYNIQRNDVKLFHHESLSRGNDSESNEKMRRLNKEKDYLYEKHQSLYGKDPFYNENLTTDMLEQEYAPKYHYEVKLDEKWAKVSEVTDAINNAREDKCVRVGMECAMDIFKWKYGVSPDKLKVNPRDEDKGFYFQGYSFVIGSDNACFERTLLLKNLDSGCIYGVSIETEMRPDIRSNLEDQINVELTGYTSKMRSDAIPKGNYQFGMYVSDKTSSLKLYNWSNWTLEIMDHGSRVNT